MDSEPKRLKVKENQEETSHKLQAKCQGKRSPQLMPEGQWQSWASGQSLAPTAHEDTLGFSKKGRVLFQSPHPGEARSLHAVALSSTKLKSS